MLDSSLSGLVFITEAGDRNPKPPSMGNDVHGIRYTAICVPVPMSTEPAGGVSDDGC